MLTRSFSYIFVVVISLCWTDQAYSLECAVCLPSNEETTIAKEIRSIFSDDQASLIGCHQINGTEENTIVKLCPPDSTSCHIQKTREWTAKSCSKIPVDDCKTANKVKYCYCKTNRCNLQNYITPNTTTPSQNNTMSISTTISYSIKEHDLTTHDHPKKSYQSDSTIYKSEYWLMILCFFILFHQ